MAHKLKITVEDIQQDMNYIRVADWSEYDSRMSLTNRVLKVEAPGIEDFRIPVLPKSGAMSYTSKSLKFSDHVEPLPDGAWSFTYSVCPNERKFTVVTHFRTVALHNAIMGFLAKIISKDDKDPVIALAMKTVNECLLAIASLKTNTIDEYNVAKAYDLYGDAERKFNNIYNKVAC